MPPCRDPGVRQTRSSCRTESRRLEDSARPVSFRLVSSDRRQAAKAGCKRRCRGARRAGTPALAPPENFPGDAPSTFNFTTRSVQETPDDESPSALRCGTVRCAEAAEWQLRRGGQDGRQKRRIGSNGISRAAMSSSQGCCSTIIPSSAPRRSFLPAARLLSSRQNSEGSTAGIFSLSSGVIHPSTEHGPGGLTDGAARE